MEFLKIYDLKASRQLTDFDAESLVQQLQIHQIELEVQNEELKIAKAQAEAAVEKYAELYEFAPSGYFTLTKNGEILEVNLYGSQLLGRDQKSLINKKFNSFISDESKPVFKELLDKVFDIKCRRTCEVILQKEGSPPVYVQLTCIVSDYGEKCFLSAADITESKNATAALQLNQNFLNNIFENSPNALWITDETGIAIRMNRACRNMFQIRDEDVIGKYDIFKDNQLEEQGFMPLLNDVFEKGREVNFVTLFEASKIVGLRQPAVQNLVLETHISPIFSPHGKLTNAIIQHFDVTDREIAEKLVIDSKVRLDKTQEMAHLGSWELNLQSSVLTWSDEVYRIFGLLPQEFAATHEAFLESVYPEDREPLNLAYFSSVENDDIGYEIEHRIIRRHTGEIRYVYEKCEHIRDLSGQIIRSVGMVQDITERKLSEQALVESEIKFRRYMESAPDSIFIVDENSRYIEVNEMVTNALGYSREEMLSFSLRDLIADEALEDGRAHYKKLKESGTAVSDLLLKHKNGSRVWMTINAVSLSPQRFLCYGKDITEKKQTENALIESEAKFRSFIQFSSDLIFSFNRDETYRFVNDAYGQLLGKDPHEIIGKTRYDFFPHDEAESGILLIRNVFLTGEKGEREAKVLDFVSGEVRNFLTTADAYKNEYGEVLYVNCVSKDITDHKKTEQALHEREEIFQSFMEHSPIYVFFKDNNLRTLNLSRNYERILGKPLSELIGKKLNELLPVSLAQKLEEDDIKAIESGNVIASEEELNGRFYSTIKFPVSVGDKLQYLAGYTIDITKRKMAEETLKASEAQIVALLAAVPDMIFIQDRQGVYLEYHGLLNDDLYSSPENFIGKKMDEVISVDLANQFRIAFNAAIQSGQVQTVEYFLQLPKGVSYFEAKVVTYGESRFLSMIRNVSDFKYTEELIKQQNEELQRLNAEKDRFFSIIAHDLRSPFSGFLGLTESLAKKLPDMTLKEIQEITFLMRNSAVHLFRLLGNLLEWSRMQRGLTSFAPKSFLAGQKIAENIVLANQLAAQKEILISNQVPDDLMVFADENMFESIIRNLLSNAVKFSPRGGTVLVSASKYSDKSVRISVKDSGIGMNKILVGHLFSISNTNFNRKGTEGEYSSGLGLIICRDFIEKHGGKLEIESEEGKGSIISFIMPGN